VPLSPLFFSIKPIFALLAQRKRFRSFSDPGTFINPFVMNYHCSKGPALESTGREKSGRNCPYLLYRSCPDSGATGNRPSPWVARALVVILLPGNPVYLPRLHAYPVILSGEGNP
jgi:hypothetical protein